MHTPTVLVVDDSPDLRVLLRFVLRERGYHVLEAADGHGAISVARQSRPDLILLDLSMPVLDGWEAARRIRAEPALDETLIVAMTAYHMRSATQSAIDAGCQTVVAKPFDVNALIDAVARLLAIGAAATAGVCPSIARAC